jgi:hypothetical protein
MLFIVPRGTFVLLVVLNIQKSWNWQSVKLTKAPKLS